MKKSKAFTLIELLAVIVILGLIALITVPTVLNKLKSTNEDLYQTQIELIKAGAVSYVTDLIAHPDGSTISNAILARQASVHLKTLGELQTAGAVDTNLLNPLCDGDNKYFSPTETKIRFTYDGKEFSYEVFNDNGEDALRRSCDIKR